jgi:chromosome segregation ATPase
VHAQNVNADIMKHKNNAEIEMLHKSLSYALKEHESRLKEVSDERDALKLSQAAAAAKANDALAERDAVAADLGRSEEFLQIERKNVSSLECAVEVLQERLDASEDEKASELERLKGEISTLVRENDGLRERLIASETKHDIITSTVLTAYAGTLQKVKAGVSDQHPDDTMKANACEYFAPSNIAFSHYLSAKLIISVLLW